jgi:hypothetical protein
VEPGSIGFPPSLHEAHHAVALMLSICHNLIFVWQCRLFLVGVNDSIGSIASLFIARLFVTMQVDSSLIALSTAPHKYDEVFFGSGFESTT